MKTIACCQPHYVPWIGYFEMVDRVDEFWFLDDVDFIKREWKNRNRIRKDARSAETKWLTVPIEHACQRGCPIDEARIAQDVPWREEHLASFHHVYRSAPFLGDALGLLERGLARDAATLADLNVGLLADLCAYLGITTPCRRTSELRVAGRKTERLLAICRAAQADAYLANNGSATYLDEARFRDASIDLAFQDYAHPVYEQRHGTEPLPFLSHLSVLDLIANAGPDSLKVLRRGAPTPSR